jgi:hypothetical protein
MAGAALVVVLDLGTGALQIPVVVEQLKAPQKLLGVVPHEGRDLERAEKSVSLDHLDDSPVALGELHGGNCGGTFETGKAWLFHPSIISKGKQTQEASDFAHCGK